MKYLTCISIFVILFNMCLLESFAAERLQGDTLPNVSDRNFIRTLSIPAITFAGGSLIAGTSVGRKLETGIRDGFNTNRKLTGIDDYTQYVPAALVFVLDAAGMKGKYKPQTQLIMYGMGVIGTAAVVQPMKRIIGRERPNGNDQRSFPSGHTSTAFAAAEFLNQEYGKKYPWVSVAGYATAGLTGYLRLYNDEHWLGDILAGAAIGMGTTKLVYWIRKKVETKKNAPKHIH
jgi:membrane-associated phospholipid phosphatase